MAPPPKSTKAKKNRRKRKPRTPPTAPLDVVDEMRIATNASGLSAKPLSRKQIQMQMDYAAHKARISPKDEVQTLADLNFGDNQPSMGTKELRFTLVDWIQVQVNKDDGQGFNTPVYTYHLDVGQPFFANASTEIGLGQVRAKVKRVRVWMLTPEEQVDAKIPLIQIVLGLPVKDERPNAGLESWSMVGQTSTIIHPDVRQPWVEVANINWEQSFENSQFQPVEVPADPATDNMALFSLCALDAVTGETFYSMADPVRLEFKVEVDLQAPIPLVPQPIRWICYQRTFDTHYDAGMSQDESPVQYILRGISSSM